MVEAFGIYGVLLAAWGLWHARRDAVPAPEPIAPREVEPLMARGDAARRLLETLP